jgi:Outer membrane protein beta-barrel domain
MKKAFVSVVTLGTLAITCPALAQNIEGAVQLGLGTSFLSYSKASGTVDLPGPLGEADIGTSITRWGLSDEGGIQLEGGYGINDSMIVGGLFALGGSSTTNTQEGSNDDESSAFNLLLAPKFDYHFSAGQPLQPFVGGAIGLVMAKTDNNGLESSATGLGLLGRGGLRWFLAPGFSVDPALNLGFQALSGSIDSGNASYDLSGTAFTIGLSIGMSGWVK